MTNKEIKTIEQFINKELKKYRTAIKRAYNRKDMKFRDKLESAARKGIDACLVCINTQDSVCDNYPLYRKTRASVREQFQAVDDELFGCFVDGKCVGYDYTKALEF